MRRYVLSALALVLLACNYAAALEYEHVVGGQHALKKQHKHQISLQVGKSHSCGGALVAADLVLTAAHCFKKISPTELETLPWVAVAGGIDVKDVTHRIPVAKIYFHKKYSKDGDKAKAVNDVALVRLQEPFDISGRLPIGLVTLPAKDEDFTGETAIVSGFGWDQVEKRKDPETGEDVEDGSSSGLLRYEFVDILPAAECGADKYPGLLCGQMVQSSTGTHKGVCSGDSGGPLVVKKGTSTKIIGIVSESPVGCDESKRGASYTKVSEYKTFIKNAMDDKPGSDTLVQELHSMIFDIPSAYKSKVITTSLQVQAALKDLQVIKPKFETAKEELDKLEKEVQKAMKLVKLVEPMANKSPEHYEKYHASFQAYTAKNEKYQAHYAETKAINEQLKKVYERLQSLEQTEKVIGI